MVTTVMSSKGQVLIQKLLRAARRGGSGMQPEVHDTPGGVLLRPATLQAKVSFAAGLAANRSRIGYRGPVVGLAEMDAALLREPALRAGAAAKPKAAPKPPRRWSRSTPTPSCA